MSTRHRSNLLSYLAAVLLIAVASVIVALMAKNVVILIAIYFTAVAAVGWIGGLGPALLATGLSYLTANWFFLPPGDAFKPNSTAFVYLFICLSIAVFSEISKRSMRRASTNAEQVKLIAHSITDGFVVVDSAWNLTYMNRATEEFNRRYFLQGSTHNPAGIFPLNLEGPARAKLKQAATDQVTIEFEEFYAPWQRWFELKASPTDVHGLTIYFRDITERKRDEDEMRRLASIIESSEDAVLGLDLKGTITSWNQSAEKLYGYTADEVVGKPVLTLLPPEKIDEEAIILARVRRGELVRHFDTVRMHKDGRKINVSVSISVIRDESGAIVGFSKIARDIGDRVHAEQALRDADQRKDDFLALLGHELRNPLAGIVNGIEFLGQPGLSKADTQEVQAIIERQSVHMSRLIDDLLDVSRIVRGKITLETKRIDLAAVARQTASDHKVLVEESGHVLDVDGAAGEVWVDGDTVRLAQVVDNLLSNAIKFTNPGGRVTLTVRADPASKTAILEVRDSGIGMTPDTVASLFEPFAQAKETLDRSRGGLGLGLAVVRGLIELHHGTISADSPGAGQGAVFTVRLPLQTAPQPNSPEPASDQNDAGHLRVLVVDDNRDVLHIMSKLLKVGGHTVAVANDGSAGVEAARQFHPDLVLCDIGLPGEMNGYKVAQALRSDPKTRCAHLVAVTGFGQEEDRRRAVEAGFDRHMTKPVGFADLQSLITELERDRNQLAP
jgi:PAS domain S-box-containing protein